MGFVEDCFVKSIMKVVFEFHIGLLSIPCEAHVENYFMSQTWNITQKLPILVIKCFICNVLVYPDIPGYKKQNIQVKLSLLIKPRTVKACGGVEV
jgi:hypothetical protein